MSAGAERARLAVGAGHQVRMAAGAGGRRWVPLAGGCQRAEEPPRAWTVQPWEGRPGLLTICRLLPREMSDKPRVVW